MKTDKLKYLILFILAIGNVFAAPLITDNVIGFEVLVAGPCKNDFQCKFGHSLIRVVMKNSSLLDDPVLAFTTDEPEPKTILQKLKFSIRSVTGLPIVYAESDLKTTVVNYSLKERRVIMRIPLQVNSLNKIQLVKNINDVFFNPGPKKKSAQTAYDSLFNNCAGEIVELLAESGFSSEFFGIALPGNLAAHLYRTYNALYPGIETKFDGQMEKEYAALPESFYQFCENSRCADSVVKNYKLIYPKSEIEFPVYQKQESNTASLKSRSEPVRWNNMKPVVQKHFEFIAESLGRR